MAKSIPYVGEIFNGDFPANHKVARVTYGCSSGNPDVPMAAQATYSLFSLPAGAIVLGARNRILEAFTASVTIALGDSDLTSGLLATGVVAPQTKPTDGLLSVDTATTSFFAATDGKRGKVFDVAHDIIATVGAADVVVGQGELFLEYALAGLD